jgi:hypothetical protein
MLLGRLIKAPPGYDSLPFANTSDFDIYIYVCLGDVIPLFTIANATQDRLLLER